MSNKHIKKFDEVSGKLNENKIKTVNSSELDTWSTKDVGIKKVGKKNFNMKLAETVLEYIRKNGVDVMVERGKFYEGGRNILAEEKDLYEYRVTILEKQDFDLFEEDYKDNNDIDQEEELNDEQKESMMAEYEDAFIDTDESMEFSVFLPGTISTTDPNLKLYAISDAMEYYRLLYDSFYENSMKDLKYIENSIVDEPEKFKNYVNNRDIKINNHNLEIISDINYRIYKDSKFFAVFLDECKQANNILEHLATLI